jgi:ATP-dependent Clp protease ATP-binding subunit ClpC
MRGDVEEKMLAVVREVSNNPKIILFIDEIHTILSSGIPGLPSDIATVLKPALVREDFRCIGATTTAEYSAYFEEDNALARRFQAVNVEETSVPQTIQILKRIKSILEAHHNVSIGKEALEQAVKLSDRYVSDRFLPDKAIDLLDEAAASKKLEVEKEYGEISELSSQIKTIQKEKERAIKNGDMKHAQRLEKQTERLETKIERLEIKRERTQKSKEFEVGVDTVREIISKWTGIPVTTLGSNEKSTLLNLDKRLKEEVVGQEEAVEAVASAIKRARTGISATDRPWATFLFLGPTGVGKTELAKALTRELFGNEDRLIQIDMSEMMEMHSVSKLIGSPPGYVGYREGGQLTEQIKRQPHSVILFDEIEKAHVDVLNILLQILEYGHLTDGKGRRVNFKNTVVILTSNIGAEDIKRNKVLGFVGDKDEQGEKSDKEIEAAYEGMKDELDRKVKEVLRPELINRLDDIVIFRALTRRDARKIVDLLVSELNDRLKEQKMKVQIDKKVKDFVIAKGFSEEYGARPLRRTLQDRVENVLANYLLEKGSKATSKMTTVPLTVKNDEVVVGKVV